MNTDAPHLCSGCGQPIPGKGVHGLCPRCLGHLAFSVDDPPDPLSPESAIRDPQSAMPKLRRFGDYELLEEIARGGMGVVFKARQISLDRLVALKLLLSGQFASPESLARFRAEALTAAQLHHPGIVPVYDVGEANGQPFLALEFVAGQNLADAVRERPLPARRAAELVRAIAEAVHYAHEHGVLHRDLKPSNVLLDEFDQPRVTDFGLAKFVNPTGSLITDSRVTSTPGTSRSVTSGSVIRASPSDLTVTGQILGSPSFIAPEQASGRRTDLGPACDIYSLGALLYHLLTGRPPFQAATITETLRDVLEREPVSPRLLSPTLPRDLETITLKCLEKEPAKRYATAHDLAEELGRYLRDEPIHARPAGRLEKLWRWCRRKPALAGSLAAVLLVGAAGLAGILWQWDRARTNAETATRHSLRAEQNAARETAQRQRAEEAVTMLELQRAEDLLEKDEVTLGMAYLTRIVREQPTNQIAARRLLSAMTHRNFALLVGKPWTHDGRVWYAEFSPDGRRVATASGDTTARVWDALTGAPLSPPLLHPGPAAFAGFSPDGNRLVTFIRERSANSVAAYRAYLWEATSGRALGSPMLHTDWITAAQFNPDGRLIVTASADGSARLWDARTGESRLNPLRHQGPVRWARFSSDGALVVTASDDKTAQVWSTRTGQPAAPPFRHDSRVEMAEFSPDGKWVVTAAQDNSTCVWNVTSGEPRAPSLKHSSQIACLQFSPEGERIVVSLHGPMTRIFNARDWTQLATPLPHGTWTTAAEFGPEGQRVLTASLDNTARLWDAETGVALTAPMQHDGLIWAAHFSPDGQSVVSASADKTARIWDVRHGSALSLGVKHTHPSRVAEFSPDGELIASGSESGAVRFWRTRIGQWKEPSIEHSPGRITVIKFSPDGERVVTASKDGTARIWNARTRQPLSPWLRHGARLDYADLSPDGQTLATGANRNPFIRFWNAQTGEPRGSPLRVHDGEYGIDFIRFSPDGRTFLTDDFGRDSGQIRDTESGRLLVELRGHEGYLIDGEFSPDGRTVATASEDGTARLWDARSGAALTEPMRHKAVVRDVCFSRDGGRMVTASEDGTAQVWDTSTGRSVGEPLRHRGWVNQAVFSPDGQLVATASDDETARLWDAHTGRPVAEPFRHGLGRVYVARFSPDGHRLLTASHSGSVRLWDVPPTVALDGTPAATLAALAEVVIGKRLGDAGTFEPVSSQRLVELRQRLAANRNVGLRPGPATNTTTSSNRRDAETPSTNPSRLKPGAGEAESVLRASAPLRFQPAGSETGAPDPFTRWLDWFLADRSTRTISPNSTITLPEYVERLMEEKTLVAAREAVLLSPTNTVALAHLADMLLTSPGSNSLVVVSEAHFLRRRAETLSAGAQTARPREPQNKTE